MPAPSPPLRPARSPFPEPVFVAVFSALRAWYQGRLDSDSDWEDDPGVRHRYGRTGSSGSRSRSRSRSRSPTACLRRRLSFGDMATPGADAAHNEGRPSDTLGAGSDGTARNGESSPLNANANPYYGRGYAQTGLGSGVLNLAQNRVIADQPLGSVPPEHHAGLMGSGSGPMASPGLRRLVHERLGPPLGFVPPAPANPQTLP
jgi:hypothetical protein